MLLTAGSVPCTNLKQRTELIQNIKKRFKKVKIEVHNDYIYYEAAEKKESNLNN